MHKYRVTGPDAERVMNRLMTRDVRKIVPGRVGYSLWCDEDGHVIDDGTLFRFGQNDYRLCCQEPQYAWLHEVAWAFDVRIADESTEVAGLSMQGHTSFARPEAAGLAPGAGRQPSAHARQAARMTLHCPGLSR